MSDVKLFKISNNDVSEIPGKSVELEKSLQNLIEKHLETFLGVRFLATEYPTGKSHGGRIDTFGIDENGCPVIIEYKRATSDNVINQGLFYLDWLLDHKANFELLVLDKYNKKTKDEIEWSSPRLLCIAGDFTNYDKHAVKQINKNIELITYKRFEKELLLFELVHVISAEPKTELVAPKGKDKTISHILDELNEDLRDRFERLEDFLLGLGDDVQMKTLKYYIAFKRIKNFACVEVHTQKNVILVHVKVDIDKVKLHPGFTRDMRKIGHFGTGNLEITLKSHDDFERAKELLIKSYDFN